jgi:hypothetical protein
MMDLTSYLLQELKDKSKEINKYCVRLKAFESQNIKFAIDNAKLDTPKIKPIDQDIEKMLKATVFLLLYNLVESTMRSIFSKIHEELNKENIIFDNLNINLKKYFLRKIKKIDNIELTNSLSRTIIENVVEQEISFSGNLDARKIREILSEYGVNVSEKSRRSNRGADLITVKGARKNLAHGHKSFSEMGRDYTAEELFEIQKRVYFYLKEVINDVNYYIENSQFKQQKQDVS